MNRSPPDRLALTEGDPTPPRCPSCHTLSYYVTTTSTCYACVMYMYIVSGCCIICAAREIGMHQVCQHASTVPFPCDMHVLCRYDSCIRLYALTLPCLVDDAQLVSLILRYGMLVAVSDCRPLPGANRMSDHRAECPVIASGCPPDGESSVRLGLVCSARGCRRKWHEGLHRFAYVAHFGNQKSGFSLNIEQ